MGEFQYFLTLFGKFTFGIIYASFYIFVSFYKFLLLPLLLLLLLSLFLPSASLQKASIVVMPLFNCFKRFSFAFGTAPAPWRRPASAGCCTRHGPRPRTAATPPLCAPSRTAHRPTTGRRASARGEQTSQPVWPPAQPGLVVGFPPSLTPHTCTRVRARTHAPTHVRTRTIRNKDCFCPLGIRPDEWLLEHRFQQRCPSSQNTVCTACAYCVQKFPFF